MKLFYILAGKKGKERERPRNGDTDLLCAKNQEEPHNRCGKYRGRGQKRGCKTWPQNLTAMGWGFLHMALGRKESKELELKLTHKATTKEDLPPLH